MLIKLIFYLKNIFGETGYITVKEGDLKINLSSGVFLESNFKSVLNFDNKTDSYKNIIKNLPYFEDIINFKANLNNIFSINLDETYKIQNYKFKSNGKISNFSLGLKKQYLNNFLDEKINKLSIIDSNLRVSLNLNEKTTSIDGKYSLNEGDFQIFSLENIIKRKFSKSKIEFRLR